MAERRLDLITIGRAAVDLYGEQIGSRLEDMTSFAKYLVRTECFGKTNQNMILEFLKRGVYWRKTLIRERRLKFRTEFVSGFLYGIKFSLH